MRGRRGVPPYITQKYLKIDLCITAGYPLPPQGNAAQRSATQRNAAQEQRGTPTPHQFLLIFDPFLTATGTGTPL